MSKPLISIVMPCYKMGQFIGRALESVGAQGYSNWELLAVDDCGPEDDSENLVKRFAARFPDQRVVWIRHSVNAGVSASRNTAIHAARGEFLAFLDPDDFWEPYHLQRTLEEFEARTGLDAVTGPVYAFYRGNLKDGGPWPIESWKKEHFPASLACHNFIQPSATVLRATVFDRIEPFVTDSELQHVEDHDLWIRMAKAGMSFHFLDEPTSYYRKHEAGATSDPVVMSKLVARLTHRHMEFFVQMHSLLLLQVAAQFARSQKALSGPAFQPLLAINRLLRALRAKLAAFSN